MAMNGERELNRGHPVPASSTKRKKEDAGCVLGSDLKLVEVRAWPPLSTPPPSPVPTPGAFPMYPFSIGALGYDGDLANFFIAIK